MFSAFANILKIPELRQRVFFTLAMLAVVRIGGTIPLPGVDPVVLQGFIDRGETGSSNALASLITAFSGGIVAACSIFALGIMPYISASIMVQLLTAVVPKLSKLSRETGGRQKITQYTRYVTIALCLIQGYFIARGLVNTDNNILLRGLADYLQTTKQSLVPPNVAASLGFYGVAITVLTAGTLFVMWLGEQITEKGIGNGTSLIISVNILSDLPSALVTTFKTYVRPDDPKKAIILVGLICLFVLTVAAIIVLTQATRKIAINYAKRMVGRKIMGGQSTHLPLKINYSGVMPIIFASAIIGFPPIILNWIFPDAQWARNFNELMQNNGPWHWLINFVLIFFFAYFWVATMFQPTQISEDLKSNGGYIPGIRPGKPTAEFLDFTMNRLTFAGACFLTAVALVPQMMSYFFKIDQLTAQFFGGTSILILVGVLLDLMRQVETHLIQQNYDGFLRKGRIAGRYDTQGNDLTKATSPGSRGVLIYVVLAALVIIGVCYRIYQRL
jgi:preprotein translocase subunit SecY